MPPINPNAGNTPPTVGDPDFSGGSGTPIGADPLNPTGEQSECPPGYTRNIITGECVLDVRPGGSNPAIPGTPDTPGGVPDVPGYTPPSPPVNPSPDTRGVPPDGGGDIPLEYGIIGCTDPSALNYEPEATRPCGQWAYVTDELGNFI